MQHLLRLDVEQTFKIVSQVSIFANFLTSHTQKAFSSAVIIPNSNTRLIQHNLVFITFSIDETGSSSKLKKACWKSTDRVATEPGKPGKIPLFKKSQWKPGKVRKNIKKAYYQGKVREYLWVSGIPMSTRYHNVFNMFLLINYLFGNPVWAMQVPFSCLCVMKI